MHTEMNGQARAEQRWSDVPPRDAAPPQDADSQRADIIGVNLRVQALVRMRKMSRNHALQAWKRRRSDPIAPYGLAFFYMWAEPGPWFTLAACTRLWLAEPETAKLPQLLYGVTEHVRQLLEHGPIDARTQLANKSKFADPMPHNATYFGIGLSTLDTPTGAWAQVCQQKTKAEDIPGEIVLALTDGSVMVAQRSGRDNFDHFQVRSTHPIEVTPGRAPFPCAVNGAEEVLATNKPDVETARGFLLQLHEMLYEAEAARLARRAGGSHSAEGRHGR